MPSELLIVRSPNFLAPSVLLSFLRLSQLTSWIAGERYDLDNCRGALYAIV